MTSQQGPTMSDEATQEAMMRALAGEPKRHEADPDLLFKLGELELQAASVIGHKLTLSGTDLSDAKVGMEVLERLLVMHMMLTQ